MQIRRAISISKLSLIITILTLTTSSSPSPTLIYGVRWHLAEAHRHPPPQNSAKNFMLMFNTHKLNHQKYRFKLMMFERQFSCTSKLIVTTITEDPHQYNQFGSKKGTVFGKEIFRCGVAVGQYVLGSNRHFQYAIFGRIIHGSGEWKNIYQQKLRNPFYQQAPLVSLTLGDWGIITNHTKFKSQIPITKCLAATLTNNTNISLLIFLGDMAYDLQGKTYTKFLSYIQPLTSKLVMLVTPGNHQSIKHKDIYMLFKESFYSPHWDQFGGYYELLAIRETLFFGYSPDKNYNPKHQNLFEQLPALTPYKTLENLITTKFKDLNLNNLHTNYTIIAFCHYPIFCSLQDQRQNCTRYQQFQKFYYAKMMELGVDVFLSGHLHFYERSWAICKEGQVMKGKADGQINFYQDWQEQWKCCMFIVQGAAGNNYFEATEPAFKKSKNHSAKTIQNTGFGLLTINNYNKTYNRINFKHISTLKQCQVADEFIIRYDENGKSIQVQQYYRQVGLIFLGVFGVVVGLGCCKKYKKMRRRRREEMQSLGTMESRQNIQKLEYSPQQHNNLQK